MAFETVQALREPKSSGATEHDRAGLMRELDHLHELLSLCFPNDMQRAGAILTAIGRVCREIDRVAKH